MKRATSWLRPRIRRVFAWTTAHRRPLRVIAFVVAAVTWYVVNFTKSVYLWGIDLEGVLAVVNGATAYIVLDAVWGFIWSRYQHRYIARLQKEQAEAEADQASMAALQQRNPDFVVMLNLQEKGWKKILAAQEASSSRHAWFQSAFFFALGLAFPHIPDFFAWLGSHLGPHY